MSGIQIGLLTTLLCGLFILIGILLSLFIKKTNKFFEFILGLSLGVILWLSLFDLIPNIIDLLGIKFIFIFLLGVLSGYLLLRLIDRVSYDFNNFDTKDSIVKDKKLIHFGLILSTVYIFYNIINGMDIYTVFYNNNRLNFNSMLINLFYNTFFGFSLGIVFNHSKQNIWKSINIISSILLSTFMGGLILFFLNIYSFNPIIKGIFLSIILGMNLFLVFGEYLYLIKKIKEKNFILFGSVLGTIIVLITLII